MDKGLIKIINEEGQQAVSARELHKGLKVGKRFTTWLQERVEKYGFIEDEDFFPILGESTGGRPLTDYQVSLDMAKELSMVENNELGRKFRKYFIAAEKQARKQHMTLPEQVQTIALGYGEMHKDVESIKDDVHDLKENFGLPGGKRRSLLSARSKQVTTLLGGHDSNAYNAVSRKVFARMGHDFKERFEVARYEDVPLSRFDEAMEYTKHWQLPTNLALDVRDLNSQTVLEMEA